jgi:hypothetical protein
MASLQTGFRGFTVAAVLLCCGCSWFHHRRHEALPSDSAPATVGSDAAAELGLKAQPLPPDEEALRAATTLATDFYEMRLRLGKSGLPDAGEMKAYRAFLCAPLADAMDSARARQQEYKAAHPDDKPPLVDGDLFSSLVEGPDSVSAAGTSIDGDGARVTLAMRAGEGDDAPHWKDDLLLARPDGIWCIADVEYRGDWPFANKGKLTTTLAEPF